MVLGFIEAVLWASLATLVGGCLVYVKSAHDEARKAAAALVRDSGAHISRCVWTVGSSFVCLRGYCCGQRIAMADCSELSVPGRFYINCALSTHSYYAGWAATCLRAARRKRTGRSCLRRLRRQEPPPFPTPLPMAQPRSHHPS